MGHTGIVLWVTNVLNIYYITNEGYNLDYVGNVIRTPD